VLAGNISNRVSRPSIRTVKLANRYIIRSLRCLIGVTVSPDGVVALCEGLGVFAAPFEVGGFEGRWVRGFVPWVHAFWGGGCFLLPSRD
jgi:hypothetical protein